MKDHGNKRAAGCATVKTTVITTPLN